MAAPVYNTTVERGSTFQLTVTYKDASSAVVNLTGWTFRMQVRESQSAASTVLTSEGGSPTIAIDEQGNRRANLQRNANQHHGDLSVNSDDCILRH